MRRVLPIVLTVAAMAGCGESNPDLIPASNAQALQQTADRIQAACSAVDRSEARAQVNLAAREIDALPRTVDEQLKQNLRDWLAQIQRRINRDCRAEEEATPEPTATEAAPTETPAATATEAPTEAPTEPPVETPTAAPTESAAPPVEPTATPLPE